MGPIVSCRAEFVPDITNNCCDFEKHNLKAKERLFGWPVSDAIAEILKRVKVAKDPRDEGEGLAQNHKQRNYDCPADKQKG